MVGKGKLHEHLPLSKAVQIIADQIADLGRKYDAKINQDRKSLPGVLDRRAFVVVGDKLTGYPLDRTVKEWSATKIMADDIEEDDLELQSGSRLGCKLGCELPL